MFNYLIKIHLFYQIMNDYLIKSYLFKLLNHVS